MSYFQEFVGLVQGPWTSATSGGDLWGVTLPQLARNNTTLRYAAMAIGALSTWHRKSASHSLCFDSVPTRPVADGDGAIHYIRAVEYYCHSLKQQSRQASVQDTVFLSLLLLFFETLRGNRKAALDHVNHGLALLLYLLTDEDTDRLVDSLAPNPKPLLAAVADTFAPLATQARSVLSGRVGGDRPLPNLAKGLRDKKQTMESFMVLLSQLSRPSAAGDSIPAVFGSLDEFEECWAAIRHRQTSMASMLTDIMKSSGTMNAKDVDAIENFYRDILGSPQVQDYCENSRKVMQDLDAALLPLFNSIIMSDADSPTYLRAIHLRLQYLGVSLFEDPPMFLDVETVHARTPLFREYLSLAEIALRRANLEISNPAHRLSLGCGLAMHLLMVAFFCRDPLARDEAAWMLRDHPGQDGLWSTRSLCALALRSRAVERENAAPGDEPAEQWRRLMRRESVFEDGGDRIVFRYLERDAATGEWVLVEEAAEVRGDPEDVCWVRQRLTGSGGPLMLDLYAAT